MNNDDIIRLAEEAGFDLDGMANMLYTVRGNHAQLERFFRTAYAAGAAAEREACAKQLEAIGCDHCAAAILARGNK